MRILRVSLVAILALSAQTQSNRAETLQSQDRVYEAAVKAYLFGYPLVIADLTKDQRRKSFNYFFHSPSLPAADFKSIVRPNNDTLYSTAWLDLKAEPMVLSVPNSRGRYYVMQMLDAWTETFAMVGTRATGMAAGNFVVVGPDWKGDIPGNVKQIKSPTNIVWLLGRIKVDSTRDLSAPLTLQHEFTLTPLNLWLQSKPAPEDCCYRPANPKLDRKTPPPLQVSRMDGAAYFSYLAAVLKTTRLHTDDAPVLKDLKAVGIEPGAQFDESKLTTEARQSLDRAVKDAQAKIIEHARGAGTLRNGWHFMAGNIGRYGTEYLDRAAIAMIGLGALPPEEAIYASTSVDSKGANLAGSGRYVIHFEKGDTPPAYAFWSITLYNADGYFAENPLRRYAIGDRDKLQYNEDGSLDLYIQNVSPGKEKESNWLPAPLALFNLTIRLYLPKAEATTGKWAPPGVQHAG